MSQAPQTPRAAFPFRPLYFVTPPSLPFPTTPAARKRFTPATNRRGHDPATFQDPHTLATVGRCRKPPPPTSRKLPGEKGVDKVFAGFDSTLGPLIPTVTRRKRKVSTEYSRVLTRLWASYSQPSPEPNARSQIFLEFVVFRIFFEDVDRSDCRASRRLETPPVTKVANKTQM